MGIDTPRIRNHTADYYNCLSRLDAEHDAIVAAHYQGDRRSGSRAHDWNYLKYLDCRLDS